MAKTKDQKNLLVEKLNQNLASKNTAIMVDYKGLTVKQMEELRNRLAKNGIRFSVVKNSLLNIALKKNNLELEKELLDRPLALAFADDEVTVSKELFVSKKEMENLEILGGIINQEIVGEPVIKQLSMLPAREELYAKIVGSLNAPISGMVNVLAGNIRNLINVLNNYRESIS